MGVTGGGALAGGVCETAAAAVKTSAAANSVTFEFFMRRSVRAATGLRNRCADEPF